MKLRKSFYLGIEQSIHHFFGQIVETGLSWMMARSASKAEVTRTDKGVRDDLLSGDQYLTQRVQIAQLSLGTGQTIAVPMLQQVFADQGVRYRLKHDKYSNNTQFSNFRSCHSSRCRFADEAVAATNAGYRSGSEQ